MKSFSSSAINKSGKKFAPKAPVRRAAPAPPRRPSVASQPSASHAPQPATETVTAESGPLLLTPEPSASLETATAEPSSVQTNHVKPSPSTAAIPIPRPKRKASVSAAAPDASDDVTTPSQPPPPPHSTAVTEPTPVPPAVNAAEIPTQDEISVRGLGELEDRNDDVHSLVPQSCHVSEAATEIRPSKRLKTTPETATPSAEAQRSTTSPQRLTPPATQTPGVESTTESQENTESQTTTGKKRKNAKSRIKKPSKETSSGDADTRTKQRKPRTRKQREPTPEGSEQVEIAPAIIKMSELCKDLRTGKKSKRETELRKIEQAELERKQAAQQNGASAEQTPVKTNETDYAPPAENSMPDIKSQSGPVMRIVNGEIVLDTSSLQVDRHADAARNFGDLEDVVENSFTRKVNQATYGKRSKTESWDEDMTDLFYRGLRMFGTDFMMISKLFPGRSRRQIKLKFNNEERRDPGRIKDTLLGPREQFDINTYSEMTNTVYDDPRVIQKELDEEKKRIEDQHAKEKKAHEELLRNPDGATDGATEPDKAGTTHAKGKRPNKKQAAKASGGGQEEILGTIDDFL
ncbi:hypothetical protein EYZ11_011508 [Aspergillus tanneri]|uniref:Transcription factor TFIIIB component B n=1 Tax=Aspergillus tanneri TaxID=1220188 RepID=A0A4S3J4R2_9EURO|nr:Transcription factor TFIIIB component B [Aspergillus tanneri]KAA8643259.1 Transcription factor TFIIIB component B [Aspergillus tanneri]THC89037.1 hypothetical protein EYZ11_011508 [Aspergillus tanneri]